MAKLRLDKSAPIEKRQTSTTAKAPHTPSKSGQTSTSPRASSPQEAEAPERVGYLLQCPPGLANVLKKELNFIGATTRDQKLFVKLQRNHDLLFLNHVKNDARLNELRTAEMVLKCPAYGRFKISQRQLGLMAEELKAAGPRRLVVTVAGKVFQRQDLARFLTKSLNERGARLDDEVEDEVWMFCIDESWYFGLPLFKARTLEHRNDRAAEREGSLPPPIAAAIAFASQPKDDDVVLDPTCGSGTLLAEFHAFAPHARLIGRDIDKNAVAIARKNLARANKASGRLVDVQTADSRQLGDLGSSEASPLAGHVTLAMANLPFGVQFGDRATNPDLYRDILRECLRVRDPQNWRGLFLTSDTEAFLKAQRALPELSEPDVMFKAKIRGELATCFRVKLR